MSRGPARSCANTSPAPATRCSRRSPSSVAAERLPSTTHDRIYAVVRRIPRGRVATYGGVARLAGLPGQARLVGYALHALRTGSVLPWHRVTNARGHGSL